MNARGRILLAASLVVLGVGVTLVGGAAKSAWYSVITRRRCFGSESACAVANPETSDKTTMASMPNARAART